MNRTINETELKYLLGHLDTFYGGTRLSGCLNTGKVTDRASIHIPLSDKPFQKDTVIRIMDIPVLFPCSDQEKWYSLSGTGIRFHHDILKSAFYLLSAYQEHHFPGLDHQGRFPWKSSIQYELGITQKPVVNYYFEVILEALEAFCKMNHLEFTRKKREAPVLFLSHDVDRVKKYTLHSLIYQGLQLTGLRPGSEGVRQQLKNLGIFARGLLSSRRDPYWTFEEMTDIEHQLHISSTWYFLERGRLKNSAYQFGDRDIRKLMDHLVSKGHEIGVHGTEESSEDQQDMNGSVARLKAVCKSPVTGIRQHMLKYSNPLTPHIQSAAGLRYDATLGFAEQIGFRNSYAHPFKLYDFDHQRPMDLWELPLTVMEVSMLQYMGVQADSIPAIIQPVLSEVTRFNGVFSLLWHNCRLEEETYPGITSIYQQVLREMMQAGYRSFTGQQTIDSFCNEAYISP